MNFNKGFGVFLSSLRAIAKQTSRILCKGFAKNNNSKCFSGLPQKSNDFFAVTAKKSAFTLSEVLITMTIIGVVAAITIPIFMNSYQQEQTVTQLKKTYSDFCNALRMSETINGTFQDWDYSLSQHDFFYTYLTPFISIRKEKKSDVQKNDGIVYLQSSGQPETGLLSARDSAYIITLMSGVQVFAGAENASWLTSYGKSYIVDINGQKKPNKFGRDLFMIYISKDLGVIPHAKDDTEDPVLVHKSRHQLLNGPSNEGYQCSKNGRGMWCMAVIMADGWKIKRDYPW